MSSSEAFELSLTHIQNKFVTPNNRNQFDRGAVYAKDPLVLGCVINIAPGVTAGGSVTRGRDERRTLDSLSNVLTEDRMEPNLQHLKLFVTCRRKEGRTRRVGIRNPTFRAVWYSPKYLWKHSTDLFPDLPLVKIFRRFSSTSTKQKRSPLFGHGNSRVIDIYPREKVVMSGVSLRHWVSKVSGAHWQTLTACGPRPTSPLAINLCTY